MPHCYHTSLIWSVGERQRVPSPRSDCREIQMEGGEVGGSTQGRLPSGEIGGSQGERENVCVHTVPSGSDRLCIIHQEDSSVSLSLRSPPVCHDSQAASKQPVYPAGFTSSSPPSYTQTASLSGLCALMSLLLLINAPPSS